MCQAQLSYRRYDNLLNSKSKGKLHHSADIFIRETTTIFIAQLS